MMRGPNVGSLILAVAAMSSGCSTSPTHEYAAVIRGPLATTDLTQAKPTHDQIAMADRRDPAAA